MKFNRRETIFADLALGYYADDDYLNEIRLNGIKINNIGNLVINDMDKIREENELIIEYATNRRVYGHARTMIYPITNKRDDGYYMRLEAQRLADLAEKDNSWTEEIKNLLNYQ
jgi:hypothetical protein